MAEVKLQNVFKVYDETDHSRGRKNAIDDVSLTIQDKEFMVIVGPSGCGKSTLLRMISGLENISGGTLSIDQKRMNDISPKDRDIAMVFQNYALYPHMTVYENLAFGLKLKGIKKNEIRERVSQAAKLLEIENELSRKPKTLSGGQRQRVAIGRAIVRRPKVFLFDEPLSNLDAKLRTQMRIELQRLHREIDATIIYVTHDQTEAMTLGHRIAVLNDGRLMQVDTPLNLYNFPANRFVAGFIGSPSMNFLKGRLRCDIKFHFAVDEYNVKIDISSVMTDELKNYCDKDVVIGVRPEDVQMIDGNIESPHLVLNVNAFENMGNEQLIYLSLKDHLLISRRSSSDLHHIGETVAVKLAVNKLLFFDSLSGKRIELRPEFVNQ